MRRRAKTYSVINKFTGDRSEWKADAPKKGLRNRWRQPMTRDEAEIFADMEKHHEFKNIEPGRIFTIEGVKRRSGRVRDRQPTIRNSAGGVMKRSARNRRSSSGRRKRRAARDEMVVTAAEVTTEIDSPSYYRGCGRGRYEYADVGVGYTEQEAFDDALDQIFSRHDVDWDASDDVLEDAARPLSEDSEIPEIVKEHSIFADDVLRRIDPDEWPEEDYRQAVEDNEGPAWDDAYERELEAALEESDLLYYCCVQYDLAPTGHSASRSRQRGCRSRRCREMRARTRRAQSERQKEYEAYFRQKMEKYGVDSPAELAPAEKSKFFEEVNEGWESEAEEKGKKSRRRPARARRRRAAWPEKVEKGGLRKDMGLDPDEPLEDQASVSDVVDFFEGADADGRGKVMFAVNSNQDVPFWKQVGDALGEQAAGRRQAGRRSRRRRSTRARSRVPARGRRRTR